MIRFWEYNVWSFFLLVALLLGSMLVANMIKKGIPFLNKSLLPTSVLGGLILLGISSVYEAISGENFFNSALFGGVGVELLELITYHTLALGFIASSLKKTGKKLTRERSREIFDSGVTTVATYLVQGIVGLSVSIVAALILGNFFSAAGILLPFGYGQGTGQAMNYGSIYEHDYGFIGGTNFGLTIAALGFLSASVGGVIHLNVMKHRGKLVDKEERQERFRSSDIQSKNEIPMQESIDKLTIQVALIAVAYVMAYLMMLGLSALIPSMKATIFGFNFLLGVIAAALLKLGMNFLMRKNVIKREYTNNFLLTRASNFFFDIMVVAGIAAIDLGKLQQYWGVIAIMAVVGLIVTYLYTRVVAKLLFPKYKDEQFLAMYGMLTGTASTGIILLRELDGEFKTPAADNLVYQTIPAIVFGFPMMLLATYAPKNPILTLVIFIVFFMVMNLILFRSFIFKGKKDKKK